jgi:3-hydroxyisobutyrate dehydrogenase
MRSGDELTPVADTEFARDATFGYRSSDLRAWVEEKTDGRIGADQVLVCDLATIRRGPEAVAALLGRARDRQPIAVDVVVEDDMRVVALGMELAERMGTTLLYRVGPPFVRARIGQARRGPLTAAEVYGGPGVTTGGLIVVGSHVGLTTRQLDALHRQHPGAVTVELDVRTLIDPARSEQHIDRAVTDICDALDRHDVIVHTSRLLVKTDDPDESLAISRAVSAGVVAVVNKVLHTHPLRFVIAKGGITSSDVATHGLEITHATVRGSMLPGLVSLWEPTSGPAQGTPYIVFAGNVGDEESLAAVVGTLTAFPTTSTTGTAAQEIPVTTTDSNPSSQSAPARSTAPAGKPAPADQKTVAVIGLGAMGLPMASRLNGPFRVHGVDIAEPRLALAAEAGITTFRTATDAVADADAVLLVVRNGAQLEEVLFADNGIAGSLRPGSVVILGSTVGVDGVAAVTPRLDDLGIDLVDAPLSGGPVRAGAGDLLIVVGARPPALAKVQGILDRLASTLSVVGVEPGAGQALKTVNQLLCGVHIAAAAEALALAAALGLDPQATLDALQAGAANSFMLGNRGPRMLQAYDDEGAEVLSRLDIFVKDMGIVGKAARSVGLPAPVAAAAEQLYLIGQAHGLGTDDDSAVIRAVAPTQPPKS